MILCHDVTGSADPKRIVPLAKLASAEITPRHQYGSAASCRLAWSQRLVTLSQIFARRAMVAIALLLEAQG
jgi:hypothetical protein